MKKIMIGCVCALVFSSGMAFSQCSMLRGGPNGPGVGMRRGPDGPGKMDDSRRMMMHAMMMRRQVVATRDGGVVVLIGNRMLKYDKNLKKIGEAEIDITPDEAAAMQKKMNECCRMMMGAPQGPPPPPAGNKPGMKK